MKKIISLALAYVGVIVGAGFASGQEILQYFVAFGAVEGALAILLSGFLFVTTAICLLELGSYFNAQGHDDVLVNIVPRPLQILLDFSFVVANFGIGIVMIAGAGSNLNQQFGLPVIVGALLLCALIIISGFLDTEKVTQVIGSVTPFLILFFLVISIYAMITTDTPFEQLNTIAINDVATTLPNWYISALNYVTFNLMTGVSMAIVMGGSEWSPKIAGRGGGLGGLIIAILVTLSSIAMFLKLNLVGSSELPMLELVNQIHPILGTIMSVIIFGMIFNTGLGMFYGVSARFVKSNPKRFRITLAIIVAAAFIMSFAGFRNLVAYLYPAIGYVGILLLITLFVTWFKIRKDIKEEDAKRRALIESPARGTEAHQDLEKELLDSQVHNPKQLQFNLNKAYKRKDKKNELN